MFYALCFILGVLVALAASALQRRRQRRLELLTPRWRATHPPVVVVDSGTDVEAPVYYPGQEDSAVVLDATFVRPNMPGSNSKME